MTSPGGAPAGADPCSVCERAPPRPGFRTCEACAARARVHTRAHRQRAGRVPQPCERCSSPDHGTLDCPEGIAPAEAPPASAAPAPLRDLPEPPSPSELPDDDAALLAQLDDLRPRTRGDCAGGERPCPWVRCRYHLLPVQRIFRPCRGASPEVLATHLLSLPETCALDVADRGPQLLEAVGELFGLTRERIRQLEERALAAGDEAGLFELAELAADQPEAVSRWDLAEGGASLSPADVDRGMARLGVPKAVVAAPAPPGRRGRPRPVPLPLEDEEEEEDPMPLPKSKPAAAFAPPRPLPAAPPAPAAGARSRPLSLLCEEAPDVPRLVSGVSGFDRVLGGGLVPGSIVLIGGDAGVGKSTLLLQVLQRLAEPAGAAPRKVLYVTGEETLAQAAQRARRLGATAKSLHALAEFRLGAILKEAGEVGPEVLAIDSIQTVDAGAAGRVGSLLQVRAAIDRLVPFAKARSVAVVLIGHVTKNQALAGPKSMEHYVDVVLEFSGEGPRRRHLWAPKKNRFGSTAEEATFLMGAAGLTEGAAPAGPAEGDEDDDAGEDRRGRGAPPFRRPPPSPLAAHLQGLMGLVPESVRSVPGEALAEEAPDGGAAALLVHRLPLRPGVVATLQLPVDLGAGEAARLARFVALLPFAEAEGGAAAAADLEGEALLAALVHQLHKALAELGVLRRQVATGEGPAARLPAAAAALGCPEAAEAAPAAAPEAAPADSEEAAPAVESAPRVESADPAVLRGEILACLEKHPEGLGSRALGRLLNRSEFTVGKLARAMVKEGALLRTGGERGPNVRLHAPAPAPAPSSPPPTKALPEQTASPVADIAGGRHLAAAEAAFAAGDWKAAGAAARAGIAAAGAGAEASP